MTAWSLFSWVSSSGRKLQTSTDEKLPDVSLTSSRCELNTVSGLDEFGLYTLSGPTRLSRGDPGGGGARSS